jgi:hypothetical protein
MPRCTHKGCGKEYDAAANADGDCLYHPGGPVFHEGLKSWCKLMPVEGADASVLQREEQARHGV